VPTEYSVATKWGDRNDLVLQRVRDRLAVLWLLGGVERRLLDVVKKQISADPTVSGKSREIYIFFFYPT